MDGVRSTPRWMLLVGVVALLAAAFAVPALAQSEDGTEASETTTEDGTDHREQARTAFAEALAAELDLSVDRVDDALTAVREQMAEQFAERRQQQLTDRLDEAVADGELTQEQADAIADAAEAGLLGRGDGHRRGPGFGHRGHGGFGGPLGDELSDDGADADDIYEDDASVESQT